MASGVVAGTILAQLMLDTKQMSAASASAGKQIKALQSPLGSLSNGFKNLNSEMFRASFVLAGLAAGLIGMVKSVGRVAYEYDKNMALVKAVTNATATEMESLDAAAKDMGEATKFGARKAAEGLLILSRMGLDAARSMQVLGPAMKLAQGQQADMKMSTELLIQQLRAFGKSEDEAARFANVLAATSSKTAADLEKLNLSLSYAGPIAHMAGISFEEVAVTLGMMYNNGIKMSRAGTGLRFTLAALLGATNASEKALARMGLTVADVSPTTHTMGEILRTVSTRLQATGKSAELVFDIFGKRAAASIGAVLNTVKDMPWAFDELLASITDTAEVERQHAEQLNSWSGQMDLAGTSVENLTLDFRDIFLPVLQLVTVWIKDLVKGFRDLSPVIKEVMGYTVILTTIFATLAAVIASSMFIFGTLLTFMKNFGALVGGTYNNIMGSIKAYNVTVGQQKIAEAALSVAMQKKIPLMTQDLLIRAKLRPQVAADIVLAAKETALLEKGSAAQLRSFNILVQKSLVKSNAIALDRQYALAAAQAAIGQETLNVAMVKGATATGVFAGALGKLKMAVGGIGGIFAMLAFIVLPALIAAWVKHRAKVKENEKTIDEMIIDVRALNSQLEKQREILEKLNKEKKSGDFDSKDAEAEVKAMKKISDIKAELVKTNPDLFESYNAQTKELRLNESALKDILALEVKRYKMETDIANLPLDLQLEKLEQQRKVALKMVELTGQNYDIKLKTYRLSLEQAKGAQAEYLITKGKPAFAAMVKTGKATQGPKAEFEKQERTWKSMNAILVGIDKQIESVTRRINDNADAVKKAAAGIDELGDSASKSVLNFDSLLKSIRRLDFYLDELAEKSADEIELLNASDFRKTVTQIDQQFEKLQRNIANRVDKINEQRKKAERKIAEKDPSEVDWDQHEKAEQAYLDLLEKIAEEEIELRENVNIKKNNFIDEYVDKSTGAERKVMLNVKKMELEKQKIFNDTLENRLKANKLALMNEKRTVLDTIKKYQKDIEDAKINMTNKAELDALLKSRGDMIDVYGDYFDKLEELYKERGKEIVLDAMKEQQALEMRQFKLEGGGVGESSIYKKQLEQAVNYYIKVFLLRKKDTKAQKEAYLDLMEAYKTYQGSIVEGIDDTVQSVLGSFKGISTELDAVVSVISGISDMAANVESGDYSSMFSTFTSIIEAIAAAIDESAQEEEDLKKRQILLTHELMLSQQDLHDSTNELSKSFLNFSRNIFNLSTPMEEVENLISDTKTGIGDILKEIYAQDPYASSQTVETEWYDFNAAGENFDDVLSSAIAFLYKLPKEVLLNDESGYTDLFRMLQDMADVASGDWAKKNKDWFQDTWNLSESMYQGLADLVKMFPTGTMEGSNFGGMVFFEDSIRTLVNDLSTAVASGLDLSKLEETYGGLFGESFANLVSSTNDLIPALQGIMETFKQRAGETYDVNGVNTSLISAGAMKELADMIFKKRMAVATTPEEVKTAHEERKSAYEFIIKPEQSDLWKQLSQTELINMGAIVENWEKLVSDDIEKLSSATSESASKFESAAQQVTDAFNNGTITYKNAMEHLGTLEAAIGNFPIDMQKGLREFVNEMKLAVMEGEAAAQEKIRQIPSFATSMEDYEENKDKLAKDTTDIINDWNNLLTDRKDVMDNFKEDYAQVEQDSKDRIDSLKAERAQVIGTFDFTETQNERSKRFTKVRELENDILEEIIATEEKLSSLREQYTEDIDNINAKIDEWKNQYGSLYEVIQNFHIESNKLTEDFIEGIDAQILALQELGAAFPIDDVRTYLGYMGDLTTGIGVLDDVLNNVITNLPKLEGLTDLATTVGDAAATAVGETVAAVSAPDPYVSPIRTITTPDVVADLPGSFTVVPRVGDPSVSTSDLETSINNARAISGGGAGDLVGLGKSMNTSGNTTVVINESIDLRGSYGITSPEMAEKVYTDVWAPARRRAQSKFLNVQGILLR